MKRIKSQAANILTALRVVLSIVLIFLRPLSSDFLIIYVLCGATDIFDGAVARKLGTASKAGALLDSIADVAFAAVYAIKYIPIFYSYFLGWLLYALLATVTVKLISLVVGFVKFKKPCFLHTYPGKSTGFAIFLLPFSLLVGFTGILLGVVCTVAFFAAVDEFLCIVKMNEYNADVKGVFAI